MAEADLGGIGSGGFAGAEGETPSVFRAASKVSLDYKDVSGLVKEMNNLYDAIKKVKGAIDSLDEGKTRDALKNLSSSMSGGGSGGIGGGGNAVRSNGGGVSFGMTAVGMGLGGAAMLASFTSNRKQQDLMTDVTDMRVSLASGNSKFGMDQANALVRSTLGPTSFGRADMNTAAQSIFGRYGTAGSGATKNALGMTAALARVTGQGASFGADLMNAANDPGMLNRMRRFTGVTMGSFSSSTQMSDMLIKASFGSSNPSQHALDTFRPGTHQFNNMMMLTGGNAALATAAVDEQRMKDRYYDNGGKGAWNDKTIANMSTSMQTKIFGANSLFVANQKRVAGKAISDEQGAALSRSGMVGSEEYLYSIQQSTKELSQKFTQYMAPLGDKIGGLAGGLSQLANILTPIALLSRGGGLGAVAQRLGIGGGGGGGVAAEAEAAGGGMAALGGGLVAGLGGVLGHIVGSEASSLINSATGRKKGQKGGFNWGNVMNRITTGAGVGAGAGLAGGPFAEVTVPGGAAIGGILGGVSAIGHELFHVGDAVGDDQSRGSDGGGSMSLTDATKLLLSRTRAGASSVNNMAPDLRLKLGKLFAMNSSLSLSSGWRSRADQEKLYARYKAGKGNLAARPGTSNHERGLAADIGPKSQYGWLSDHAKSVGLVRPMTKEPWHWEPPNAKSRGGSAVSDDGGSATSPLGGMVSASVRSATGGGAEQWSSGGGAPGLSGVAIQAMGGGTSVGGADASGGASAAWDGAAGSMSINDVAKLAASAGVPKSQIARAVAIAMSESGLDPHKHYRGPKDDSYGLWQINMLGGMGPERSKKYHLGAYTDLYNPSKNAEAMYDISGHGNNWGQWSTNNVKQSNNYSKHMAAVNSALASGVGDPVAAPASTVSFGSAPGGMHVRGGGRSTVINLTVKEASYAEAVRMARIIKGIIDGDTDTNNARAGG